MWIAGLLPMMAFGRGEYWVPKPPVPPPVATLTNEARYIEWKWREDLARAVRWLRSHAAEYGWGAETIGTVGFSAGGHLSIISAVSSQDRLYDPVDAMDVISPHLNFAVGVYPAYLLDDGATGPNAKRGDGANLLPELKFDAKTPPMLLLHGDNDDIASSLGSVKIYEELYRRKIPAQLMIYSDASHGLNHNANVRGWERRIIDWIESRGC